MHAMVVEVGPEIEQLVFEISRRPETTGDPNTLGEGCRLAVPTENPIQRFSPDVTCFIGLKTGHNIYSPGTASNTCCRLWKQTGMGECPGRNT